MDYNYQLNPLRLNRLKMEHGKMVNASPEEQLEKLIALSSSEIIQMSTGGSMGISATIAKAFAASKLENFSVYGVVGGDAQGLIYKKELVKTGIVPLLPSIRDSETGSCIVVQTPDKQLSMSRCLGANVHFRLNSTSYEQAKTAELLVVDGHLLACEGFAEDFGILLSGLASEDIYPEVWLTLGSVNVIQSNPQSYKKIIPNCDLVWGDFSEVHALIHAIRPDAKVNIMDQEHVMSAIVQLISPFVNRLVITKSEDGAELFKFDEQTSRLNFPTKEVKVADSSGAGDVFFGVLLGSYSIGNSLEIAMRQAVEVATESTQYLGSRMPAKLLSSAVKQVHSDRFKREVQWLLGWPGRFLKALLGSRSSVKNQSIEDQADPIAPKQTKDS